MQTLGRMPQRLQYTREELLELRERIAVHTFPDPVPPNCPMHTDSNLLLLQTTVSKRQKESSGTKLPCMRSTNATTSAIVGEVTNGKSVLGGLSHGNLKEGEVGKDRTVHSGTGQEQESVIRTVSAESSIAEVRKPPFTHVGRLIRPPPLEIPFVTIGARDSLSDSTTDNSKRKTMVDVDMERMLVARLRQQQEQGRNQQLHKFSNSMAMISHTNACDNPIERLVPPPAFASIECSHSTPDAASPTLGSINHSGNITPQLCADTAVSINNISLFRPTLGRRYFNFTRSLGIWNYLSSATGAANAFISRYVIVTRKNEEADDNTHNDHSSNNNNNSSGCRSGCQSSIGLSESRVTPVHIEISEEDTLGVTEGSSKESIPNGKRENQQVHGKKPHRRRTNRTHAAKREHRRVSEVLLQKTPLPSEENVEEKIDNT